MCFYYPHQRSLPLLQLFCTFAFPHTTIPIAPSKNTSIYISHFSYLVHKTISKILTNISVFYLRLSSLLYLFLHPSLVPKLATLAYFSHSSIQPASEVKKAGKSRNNSDLIFLNFQGAWKGIPTLTIAKSFSLKLEIFGECRY